MALPEVCPRLRWRPGMRHWKTAENTGSRPASSRSRMRTAMTSMCRIEEETVVYKENAARMMTDMLVSVVQEGTGKGLAIREMPCAGKTGTTNDNKDGWFVGYTRYYTTSVWVGYDMPKELPTLKGSSYPGNIWHDFMENIHTGLTPLNFLPYVSYTDGGQKDDGKEQQKEDAKKEEKDKNRSAGSATAGAADATGTTAGGTTAGGTAAGESVTGAAAAAGTTAGRTTAGRTTAGRTAAGEISRPDSRRHSRNSHSRNSHSRETRAGRIRRTMHSR